MKLDGDLLKKNLSNLAGSARKALERLAVSNRGEQWSFGRFGKYVTEALIQGTLIASADLPASISMQPIKKWFEDLRTETAKDNREYGYLIYFSLEEEKWARSKLIVGTNEDITFSSSDRSRLHNAKLVADVHSHPKPEFWQRTGEFSSTDIQNFASEGSLFSFLVVADYTLMLVRTDQTKNYLPEAQSVVDRVLAYDASIPFSNSANFAQRIGCALYALINGSDEFVRVYPLLVGSLQNQKAD